VGQYALLLLLLAARPFNHSNHPTCHPEIQSVTKASSFLAAAADGWLVLQAAVKPGG
jgi:hypothetical protein